MLAWNIDFTLVAIYLVIVLIVGILKGRNVHTVKQYAIADRNYSTTIMVAAIVSTMIDGGSVMGLSEKIVTHGLIFAVLYLGDPIVSLLIAKFVAPRMSPFQGMISIGDIMNKFYGKVGRVVTGAAGTLLSVGYVGAQASAIGYFFSFFLEIPHTLGILIACSTIVIYSAFGGIKAVTATDVIQFGILIVSIPTITNIALSAVGGYDGLFASIPVSHRNILPDTGAIRYLFLGFIFYLPFLNPAITQRLLMAKNTEQMQKSMYVSAAVEIPFYFYVSILALIAITLNPEVLPNAAIPFVLDAAIPVGFKGLMIVGILAIIMSTADSYLNVASINLVHDVCNPLRKKPMTDLQELRFIRIVTAILGFLGMLAAISFESIIDLILNALGVWGPIVVVPLFAGIFGFKASGKSFVLGAISGVIVFLLWVMFDLDAVTYLDPLIPSIMANAVVFFGSHYFFKSAGKMNITGSDSGGEELCY